MKRSASNLKKILLLWSKSAKVRLMARMAYPGNFFILTVSVIVHMAVNIIFINVIFTFVDDFSGWSYHEALAVVASYMIIDGFNWAVFANLAGITMNISNGKMDFAIVKPLDTQLYVSIFRADPEDWSRVLIGLAVLAYAASGIGLGAGEMAVNIFFYGILIVFATVIFYSINIIIKSVSFWTTQGWGLQTISESVLYGARYPADIFFHRLVRAIFHTIIPLAFMATVPAKILARGPNPILLAGSAALAVVFFYLSRKLFYFALSRYSSASS